MAKFGPRTLGTLLPKDTQNEALHWLHHERRRHPEMTDEQWLSAHVFYTARDGSLNRRYSHCVAKSYI